MILQFYTEFHFVWAIPQFHVHFWHSWNLPGTLSCDVATSVSLKCVCCECCQLLSHTLITLKFFEVEPSVGRLATTIRWVKSKTKPVTDDGSIITSCKLNLNPFGDSWDILLRVQVTGDSCWFNAGIKPRTFLLGDNNINNWSSKHFIIRNHFLFFTFISFNQQYCFLCVVDYMKSFYRSVFRTELFVSLRLGFSWGCVRKKTSRLKLLSNLLWKFA